MLTLCVIPYERISSHPEGEDGMKADGFAHLVHLLLPLSFLF